MIEIHAHRWTQTLDDSVAAILRRAGIKRPPVNAIDVARRLGYAVLWDDSQQPRARIAMVCGAPSRGSRTAIFLRPERRPERVQWAVAHELGELYAMRVLDQMGVSSDEEPAQSREQLANGLATRLLLPMKWFAEAAVELDYDLIGLKTRFSSASHELIARRMLDLSTPVVVSIFDHGKLQFRRWNRPHATPLLTAAEERRWRSAHVSGDVVRHLGTPRMDVWPVHEPNWKREIIRLELSHDEQAEADF
jgi:hypothetical protein